MVSNTTNSNVGGTEISGATNAGFPIPTTLTAGEYFYFVEVRASGDAASVRSNVAMVTVSAAAVPLITITAQPAANTNVTAGSISGSLNVSATVTLGATISYQWFSNTTPSNDGGTSISGATGASFPIPWALAAGTYFYFVEVRAFGADNVRSQAAEVTVSAATSPPFIEMVWVPGGSFELGREMGTAGFGNVTPISTVNLTGFGIGKYLVTQEQYQIVMGTNPSWFSSNPAAGEVQERRPVEQVSWYDAIVFCNRLSMMEGLTPAYEMQTAADTSVWSTDPATWGTIPGWSDTRWNAVQIVEGSTGYRLPTEAQWEYAAKGGNDPPEGFTFAGSNNIDDVAWHSGNSEMKTREVGLLAPNILGIHDMIGNVRELVWDWWGNYTANEKTDPTGAVSGTLCVRRGGSWINDASLAHSVLRGNGDPHGRWYTLGFRLVRP